MFGKSILVLLAALLALTAAEINSKHAERQAFPEQFSQFTNKFQEALVNPSGAAGNMPSMPSMPNMPGMPAMPQLPIGQMPAGFAPPAMPFSRRQIGDIASSIPFPMGSRHGYY